MRKSIVFGFVVFAVLLSVTGVFAQTTSSSSQDDDGVQGEIPLLTPDSPYEDAFTDDIGARLYGFYGSAGDVVTLTMTQISDELDPFLVLLGPSGEVIASDDDSGTEANLAAAINEVSLPIDGSYLVVASSFANIDSILDADVGTLEYVLTLEGSNPALDDPNYDPDTFFLYYGQLEDGATVEGESSEELPVYYYAFNAEEGDNLNLVIEEADFDTILHLFDADGNRIAVNNDDIGSDAGIRDFTAPATGIYFLMATHPFFYNAGIDDAVLPYESGEFSLSLNID